MERDYEEIFQKVLDYEQTLHEKNRKRIKIGLKCIWIVPLFFLALLFLTGSNKVIFLILWIVSLFALSIYLIVVEYTDHNLQEKIMELKGEEGTIEEVTPADFDRAAQIIRKTREMIGEGLNSQLEKILNHAYSAGRILSPIIITTATTLLLIRRMSVVNIFQMLRILLAFLPVFCFFYFFCFVFFLCHFCLCLRRGLPKKPWKELRTVITMRH